MSTDCLRARGFALAGPSVARSRRKARASFIQSLIRPGDPWPRRDAPLHKERPRRPEQGCKDFQASPKFSLAGNCGAPERLNASLTDKLYFFSWVSSHDGELLRHFLDFYTARGIRFKEPGWARLVVSPFRESRREVLDEFVHQARWPRCRRSKYNTSS
jgi:hypothetical protein